MGIRSNYYIKPINYRTAMDLIIKNHYLHRKAPCSFAFGLFERRANNRGLFKTDQLIGVICYGTPASRSLQKGICGSDEADNVKELTRLWVRDNTPKNAESFLIGNTIKLINAEILVSYAEVSQGHLGVIYQASNWLYTGLSDSHCRWVVSNTDNKHSRHIFDEYGGVKEAKKALGDRMVRMERPRKHRYIYFNCGKYRKRELLGKLRYPILPYPKN